MILDAPTIATFAMFSLLSGAAVCTMPTEQEEVKKRYDDMVQILSKTESIKLVEGFESYFPKYPEDKWPWAMSYEEYLSFLRKYIVTRETEQSMYRELCVASMAAVLANEEIEEKYRLSRVKPKLLEVLKTGQVLPF